MIVMHAGPGGSKRPRGDPGRAAVRALAADQLQSLSVIRNARPLSPCRLGAIEYRAGYVRDCALIIQLCTGTFSAGRPDPAWLGLRRKS